MKRVLFPVIFAAAAASNCAALEQKGITLVSWSPGGYLNADASMARLAATGANWVSIIAISAQPDARSTEILSPAYAPSDDDLRHAIARAHALGLKALLKFHVDLPATSGAWRGQIGAGFDEQDWRAWFKSYTAFIERYADLARDARADEFCVGTELTATQGRVADWRAVIAAARRRFHGPLTYAANHGDETQILWWDALDFIGVDAYYPLSAQASPSAQDLRAGWAAPAARLSALSTCWGKPVLITEIGYQSRAGSAATPWDAPGRRDLDAQARLYEAAFEALKGQPWLAGMYWWAWEAAADAGGPGDDGFSPQNKPAESVLHRHYRP